MRVLLDLLLPPHCPGCGREGTLLCERLPPASAATSDLNRPERPSDLPWRCRSISCSSNGCATFSGPVREAIHALKYGGERRLGEPLAAALAERWAHVGVGAEIGDVGTSPPDAATRARFRPSGGTGPRDGHAAGAAAARMPRTTPSNGGPARARTDGPSRQHRWRVRSSPRAVTAVDGALGARRGRHPHDRGHPERVCSGAVGRAGPGRVGYHGRTRSLAPPLPIRHPCVRDAIVPPGPMIEGHMAAGRRPQTRTRIEQKRR